MEQIPEFKDCLLPKNTEEKYQKYHHYFDFWRLNRLKDKTEFFLLGKWVFDVEKKLSDDEIIMYANLYEWAFRNGFESGKKEIQEQIKSALGIYENFDIEDKKIAVKNEPSYQAYNGCIFQTKEECEIYEKNKEAADNRNFLLLGTGLVIVVLLLLNFIK